jgi:beta-aspartyl-peptidase (threonine type)
MKRRPAIAVHGGAGQHDEEALPACRAACGRAALAGMRVLEEGGAALDAVEQAVRELEDESLFNAGAGSALNAAGVVEVDASIMDGEALRAGAVGSLRNYRHPVTVARRLLEDGRHVLLVGGGAEAFARSQGLDPDPPDALVTSRAVRRFVASLEGKEIVDLEAGNTVGAVARDARGSVAAATSTGGVTFKLPGRLGDTPILGSGTYADDRHGAASATGIGENILRVVLAKHAVDLLARRGATPAAAARRALADLGRRTRGKAGVVLVDARGRVGVAFTTPHMPHAFVEGGRPLVEGS